MDPRRRKKLENCLKIHKKIDKSLEALNIINIKMSCDGILFKNDPGTYLTVTELENTTKCAKTCIEKYDLADRYKEPYACISSYSNIVQDLSILIIWHSKKNFIPRRRKLSALERSKLIQSRIKNLIKFMTKKINFLVKEDLLFPYIKKVLRDYNNHTWMLSCDYNVAEIQLKKLIKVLALMPSDCELLPNDKRGGKRFIFLVKLLNFCSDKNIKNSEIVVNILSFIMKIKVESNDHFIFVQQPVHSLNCFSFILKHIQNMGAHDVLYSSEHSKNAWKYCSNFSLVDAVVCGDESRVKDLISFGFDVFPQDKRLNQVDEFPDLSQVVPLEHRIILRMMNAIKLSNLRIMDDANSLTEKQKTCFLIVLRESAGFFVSKDDINESLQVEYEYNISKHVSEEKCMEKFLKNLNLVDMYTYNFNKFAETSKLKNTFKYFINLPYNLKRK